MVVVALSGQPGCGSTTVSRLLAQVLGIEFFSVGNYTKKIALNISGEPEETQRTVEFWQSEKGKNAEFHHESDMMQKGRAAKGNVVIDSKLAIHMLRGFANISVWLKAPLGRRAERVAKRDSISVKEAEAILKEKEKLERDNWERIYGFDYFSQEKEADIVIDVGEKRPDQIAGMIVDELRRKGVL